MTRALRTIPAEDQLLCEHCGYVLTGLPAGTPCPECGRDAADSDPDLRRLPAWEDPADGRPEILRFLATTLFVIFRPRRFYRTLVTRHDNSAAYSFALAHWAISSLLLGTAVYLHVRWFPEFAGLTSVQSNLLFAALMVAAVFFFLELTTSVAARLTQWEAAYRGLRMPLPVVLRAMYFHAAHYVPVCAIALLTVVGYQYLLSNGLVSAASAPTYLYVLCAEVVAAAFYLFKTYWTGMRNVMYANR